MSLGGTLSSVAGGIHGATGGSFTPSSWGKAAKKGIKKGTNTLADLGSGATKGFTSGLQQIAGSDFTKYGLEAGSVPIRGLASVGNLVRGQNPAEPWTSRSQMLDFDTWKSAGLGAALVGAGAYAYPYLAGDTVVAGGVSNAVPGSAAVPGIAGDAMLPGALGVGGLDGAATAVAMAAETPAAALSSSLLSTGMGGAGAALPAAGGMNPWLAAGLLGGKGVLSYLGAKDAAEATQPYAAANRRAMNRLEDMAQNPNQMYQNDLGLRQMRKNALDAVTSRQLATTGGTEGGNYSRQLMNESAAIDRQNLMALANLEATIMGQAAPYAQANMSIGNPVYQGASAIIDDRQFMDLLGQLVA